MTDKGFSKLVETLNADGLDFEELSDIRLNITMLITARNILKKEIQLNPYEHLFSQTSSPEEKTEMNKINELAQLLLPYINDGIDPDFELLAQKTGLDMETIQDITQQLTEVKNKL